MTKGLCAGANNGNNLSVQEQGVGLLSGAFQRNLERKEVWGSVRNINTKAGHIPNDTVHLTRRIHVCTDVREKQKE